ncbi:nephrin-like isoform X2 [Argopecten irradians]|uniref:nephrin-like isoform X2 n=1 Tax=Argopecten irradians TaxID=31199 RepID=UPI00371FBD74
MIHSYTSNFSHVLTEMEVIVLIVVLVPCLYADSPISGIMLSPSGSKTISAGENASIECQVKGGNPLATLYWRCKGLPVQGYNISGPKLAASRLIIPIDKSYHGQQCVCNARHLTRPDGVFATKNVTFDVIYSPTGAVSMTPSGSQTFQTLSNVTLTCQVRGDNPLARFTWRCKRKALIRRQWSAGNISRSSLSVTVDTSYHLKTCTCTAWHNATRNGRFGEANVKFDILYSPVVTLDPTLVHVKEGSTFTKICSARGNPTPTISWHHGSYVTSDDVLTFTNISRLDAGNYTCNASATHQGVALSSVATLQLVVLYGPDVDVYINNTKENTTNLALKCTAKGVPATYNYTWTHSIGSTVIRDTFAHVTNSGSVSTLIISRARLQDMGMYKCEVENGFPGRDGQIVQTAEGFLSVTGSPRVIGAKKNYFPEKNASLAINMTFLSFPEADATTLHHTGPSSPPPSQPTVSVAPVLVEVAFYNKTVSIDGFVVQILFNKFETGHRGQYQLFINNSYDYNYDFEIEISDKPDAPTHLVIDGITENSARISWLPGEDNGHPQTFTISYWKFSEEQQQNVSLNYTVTEFTVTKLAESTKYVVILYASNEKGASEKIDATFHTNSESTEPEDRPGDNNGGMKDNILYESAGPDWAPEPGPSTINKHMEASHDADAQPKQDTAATETRVYAEVSDAVKSTEQSDPLTPTETKTDWMKDNILYESTGPTGMPQADPSTQTSSEEAAYAEVQKPQKDRTEHEMDRPTDGDNDGMKANVLYESAGSNESQQPGPSTQGTQSDTAAYAEVQ